jgi:hypothetical protein
MDPDIKELVETVLKSPLATLFGIWLGFKLAQWYLKIPTKAELYRTRDAIIDSLNAHIVEDAKKFEDIHGTLLIINEKLR